MAAAAAGTACGSRSRTGGSNYAAGAGAAAKLGGNVQTKTPDDLLHGQLPEMHGTAGVGARRRGCCVCVCVSQLNVNSVA